MRLRVRFPLVAATGATGIDCSLAACLLREDSGDFSEFHPDAWPRSRFIPSPVGLSDTRRLADDTLNSPTYPRTTTSRTLRCSPSCDAIHWPATCTGAF